MTHNDVVALLGVYALDSTSEEEREEIEAHLATCAPCQAEAAAYRETAAAMAAGLASGAPEGLWKRIAAATFGSSEGSAGRLPPPRLVRPGGRDERLEPARWRRVRVLGWGVGAAAVAVALALASYLGAQVGELRAQLHTLGRQAAAASVAEAAAAAAAGPHWTVTLTGIDGSRAGTVVVAREGVAYWLSSRLAPLPASRTYQLWGLVRGRPVSLGLLGSDPRAAAVFRLGSGTTKVMVTAEPSGGVPLPTSSALAVGSVPQRALG